MAKKTQPQMMQELYQAVVGIAENPEENGIIGDMAELKQMMKDQNSRVRKNEGKVNKIWGILIGVGAVGGTGLGLSIQQLVGG